MMRDMSTTRTAFPMRYQFSVDEYARLVASGLLDQRGVELIDGEIVQMPPQGEPHFYVFCRTTDVLKQIFPGDQFWVRPQGSLQVGSHVPDPDIAVLSGPAQKPGKRTFNSSKPLLVVEISDTTLSYDLNDKASLYASRGIEDYWVMDVEAEEAIVHRMPAPDPSARFGFAYTDIRRFRGDEPITPLAAGARTLTVRTCFE